MIALFRRLAVVAACLLFALPLAAQPTIDAVVNGASFKALLAPGGIVSIFGQNLSPETTAAETVPLPTSMSGASVSVNGIVAPLYFVSPEQVNAQIPFEASGGRASFTVTTPAGVSAEFVTLLQPTAPGIFTASGDGQGPPLLLDADFSVATNLSAGERGIFYATGLGPVTPAGMTGQGGSTMGPLNWLAESLEIYISGRPAAVEFAGLAPGLVGVYQVNFIVPDSPNSDRMVVVAGGRSADVADFPVAVPEPVRGSGRLVTENREIGEFSRIQIIAVAGVRVQVGPAGGSLEIEAEDNLISLIDTTASQGTLRITATRPYTTSEGPTVTVATPTLDRVEILGVGSIEASDVSGELFQVRLNGVGSIQATGAVDEVDVISEGAGSVALFGLGARRARVQLFGAGNVEVNATESLFARLSGVGNISYSGGPAEIDTAVLGVGTIRPN